MSYRRHDSNIPVSVHNYDWHNHIYIGLGNELVSFLWCINCDSHARDCVEMVPGYVAYREGTFSAWLSERQGV